MATLTQVLVCKTCTDCDDWVIGNANNALVLVCMTCGTQHEGVLTLASHPNLTFQDAKPALARGATLDAPDRQAKPAKKKAARRKANWRNKKAAK